MTQSIYTDGGVFGRNPSPVGGAWAWCLIEDDEPLQERSGVLDPEDVGLPAVSNNATEMMAALKALEFVGRKWKGVLYTDSRVTMCRLMSGDCLFAGLPGWMVRRIARVRLGRKWTASLVGGHPTRAELKTGRRADGAPVSKWNVRCDLVCTELMRRTFG